MTLDALLSLLGLPAAAVLSRRVAKSDLEAQLAKPADRRLVADRVESLHWHAALNAANTGLPPDGMPGLAIVTIALRGEPIDRPSRLLSLVHAAVPDPLLLVSVHADSATSLSIKPAIGEVLASDVPDEGLPPQAAAALPVGRATSIANLHARWCECVLGLQAWQTTGRFPQPALTPEAVAARREQLTRIVTLDSEITKLTTAARQEAQAGRRADINLRLQDARRERQEAIDAL